MTEKNRFEGLMAITEASILYGTSVSTIKRKVREGVLIEGEDIKNYGRQWVVTEEAMDRVFGKPISKLSDEERAEISQLLGE